MDVVAATRLLEFGAQAIDEDLQVIGRCPVVTSPDFVEQHAVGDHTPCRADHSLDVEGAQRLAEYLVDEQGNDGLVISGTTGEGTQTSV